MKLLILGGTVFVGKHVVLAALAQGHEVTLFNRGTSRPATFPDIEQIHGNRDGELDRLQGRRWDAVIDTCGYVPRVVKASVEALSASVDHYTFVSSVSVYKTSDKPKVEEGDPVLTMEDPTVEQVTGETYGPLKALCEQEVTNGFKNRALIVRPGLIVGPDDASDRFTYWPVRFDRGGEVLVPDAVDQPLQVIDVRDLAAWIVRSVTNKVGGTFNLAAPEEAYMLNHALEMIRDAVNPNAVCVPVSHEFLAKNGVGAWMDLPLYLGGDVSENSMMRASIDRALATGLTIRSLEMTTKDTLAYAKTRSADHSWRAGLKAEREIELLRTWNQSAQP